MKKTPRRQETELKKKLLLDVLKNGPKTANQIIQEIFERDIIEGTRRSWKFYVHLNKLLSPLEKESRIEFVTKSKDKEKIWKAL